MFYRLCVSFFVFLGVVVLSGCPPKMVTVPDVCGMTEAEATTALTDIGFNVGSSIQHFSTSPIGTVLAQCPIAGMEQAPGTLITCTISKGVEVPDLTGFTQSQVEAVLSTAGLHADLSWQIRDTSPHGIVDAQLPTAGSGVEPGSSISVTLSLGHALRVCKDTPAAEADQDGFNWATAYGDIQEALDAAAAGGFWEVWVAAGNYDEARTGNADGSLVLKSGIALYGGFNGTEDNKNDRDWGQNTTIINGTNGRGTGLAAYHVVRGVNNATLDGFTISCGNANSGSSAQKNGAGMYNASASSTVTNCIFAGNTASIYGGGMYNVSCSPTVTNCTFAGNTAGGSGGGIGNKNASPRIINCTFTGNLASNYGGGMYNWDSDPTLTNCSFIGNRSEHSGGGIQNSYRDSNPSPVVTNCIFTGNTSRSYGGDMSNFGDMYSSNNLSLPKVANCIFWGNDSASGNEFYNYYAAPQVAYSCVTGGYNDGTNSATMVTGPPLFVGAVASGSGGSVSAYDSATATTVLTHTDMFTTGALVGLTLWVDMDNDDTVDTPFPIAANDTDTITVYGDASATTTFVYEVWDYRLQEGSPCIDTGVDASDPAYGSVTDDLNGIARPQDGDGIGAGSTGDGSDYDIGAYEF